MATCPDCGANSRSDPTFIYKQIMYAKPVGTFSLAGTQMKTSVVPRVRLSHSCGWSVVGRIDPDGKNLIVDPKEQ